MVAGRDTTMICCWWVRARQHLQDRPQHVLSPQPKYAQVHPEVLQTQGLQVLNRRCWRRTCRPRQSRRPIRSLCQEKNHMKRPLYVKNLRKCLPFKDVPQIIAEPWEHSVHLILHMDLPKPGKSQFSSRVVISEVHQWQNIRAKEPGCSEDGCARVVHAVLPAVVASEGYLQYLWSWKLAPGQKHAESGDVAESNLENRLLIVGLEKFWPCLTTGLGQSKTVYSFEALIRSYLMRGPPDQLRHLSTFTSNCCGLIIDHVTDFWEG